MSLIAQEHHRAIIEAIANREGTRAESVAREHSRVARQNLAHTLEDWEALRRIPGGSLISLKASKNLQNPLVRFDNQGGVAVITIDNPPVNALSPGVPEGTRLRH